MEDFFTDEVISDQSLMKTLASFAYSVDTFLGLRTTYSEATKRIRKSYLKAKLSDIDILLEDLKVLLDDCAARRKMPNMDSSMLCQTYIKKAKSLEMSFLNPDKSSSKFPTLPCYMI